MQTRSLKPSAPSEDKRWRLVNATMRRNGNEPDALIEALHTVQEAFGYLDDIALRYVASNLKVPYPFSRSAGKTCARLSDRRLFRP
jgi:bidirectional [NiFe] hydrogenase diaphorase subunit